MAITNNYGLTNEQISKYAPSVLASGAHESRSERYLYIGTVRILDALRETGYVPTTVMQSLTRLPGRAPFTKHLLRLRKLEHLGTRELEVPEIVLINSHDGSSAYVLMAGIFRLVCSNGMIVGDIGTTLRVLHRGNIIEEVLRASTTIS